MPFLPIHDDNRRRHIHTPYANWGLIFACVMTFLWQAGLSPEGEFRSAFGLGVIPATLTGEAELPPPLVIVPAWATLATSLFLHADVMHLAGNMLFLYIFGDNVEDSMGHARFVAFYALCGVAAGLAHTASVPASEIPLIGASGAISGVIGAYVLLHPNARITVLMPFFLPLRLRAWLLVAIWFGFQLVAASAGTGATPTEESGVAWWAHIGGFLAGLTLIVPFKYRDVRLFSR